MKSGSHEYFIGLIPPSPTFGEAFKLKQYFKETYESKAALNSPPHITLHMPFQWKDDKEAKLTEALAQFVKRIPPFPVVMNNFGSFPPRVIYIHVDKTPELEKMQGELERMAKTELNLFNAEYKDMAYHPHLTLAFQDLAKPMFVKAWAEFHERKFSREFTAEKMTLLKHDGKMWRVFKDFRFAG